QPADQPTADVLGPADARGEVNRPEVEAVAQRIGGGARLGRLVDDPDLDDALGAGPLEDPRDLRPGDAEQLGDARLRLAKLVVEPARVDQLLDIGQSVAPSWSGCTSAHYTCARRTAMI